MNDDEARMLYEVYAQRAKLQPERSHALERRFYGDPMKYIAFEPERGIMQKARQQYQELFVGLPPYEKVMTIWTNWIALSDRPYPDGDANLQDTRDFMRTGEAVEAMINNLPRHLWWAIRKSRGISTVWIFPHLSIADALLKSEEILTPKMKNHIATSRYFD